MTRDVTPDKYVRPKSHVNEDRRMMNDMEGKYGNKTPTFCRTNSLDGNGHVHIIYVEPATESHKRARNSENP